MCTQTANSFQVYLEIDMNVSSSDSELEEEGLPVVSRICLMPMAWRPLFSSVHPPLLCLLSSFHPCRVLLRRDCEKSIRHNCLMVHRVWQSTLCGFLLLGTKIWQFILCMFSLLENENLATNPWPVPLTQKPKGSCKYKIINLASALCKSRCKTMAAGY